MGNSKWFLLLIFMLIGCEYKGIRGIATIVEKKHIEEVHKMELQYAPFPVGVPSGIKDFKYVPVHEPERWIIVYEGYNIDNELLRESINISKDKWNTISIGDRIRINR